MNDIRTSNFTLIILAADSAILARRSAPPDKRNHTAANSIRIRRRVGVADSWPVFRAQNLGPDLPRRLCGRSGLW
jgi:hypothetical protein